MSPWKTNDRHIRDVQGIKHDVSQQEKQIFISVQCGKKK